MNKFSLSNHADSIADTMHRIAVWSKNHPNSKQYNRGILKLPPVFSSEKYGDPKQNLIAMIKTLADYEESKESLTLSDLPKKYNEYGGGPKMEEKDLRKVHNWLQQVSLGVRAAMLINEMENPSTNIPGDDAAERVFNLLFAHCPSRTFVTFASDNRYEIRPLRYADNRAKLRWLKEELNQLSSPKLVTATNFGASPTKNEWEIFGLRGQIKTAISSVSDQIKALSGQADQYDITGRFFDADALDEKLKRLNQNLKSIEGTQ